MRKTSYRSSQLIRAALATATAAIAPAGELFAQDATTMPATAPAGVTALFARITALRGVVQVRNAEDQPWKPAAVGMELDEGAEFRTGPRSAVEFIIPPDQTITLDRLGTIKVLEAVKQSGKVTTALGMKYGRARYDIQAADLQHDSTIRSPGSTLAIRGTDVTFEDMAPFAPSATSREGRAMFKTNKRQFVSFGGSRRANVSADSTGPAQTALVKTRTDPQSSFSGRSDTEKNLILTLPSLGGRDLADAGIPAQRGREREQESQGGFLPPINPGPGPTPEPIPEPMPEPTPIPNPSTINDLSFDLSWTGMPYTDIDLEVWRGDNEKLIGRALNAGPSLASPSGGVHNGNREADEQGFGYESVRWSPTAPADYYLIRVILRNDVGANATINVRRDSALATTSTQIYGYDQIFLGSSNPFFQVLVPIPPDISSPPPTPPLPPEQMGPMPPPQQGPDTMNPFNPEIPAGLQSTPTVTPAANRNAHNAAPWPTERGRKR